MLYVKYLKATLALRSEQFKSGTRTLTEERRHLLRRAAVELFPVVRNEDAVIHDPDTRLPFPIDIAYKAVIVICFELRDTILKVKFDKTKYANRNSQYIINPPRMFPMPPTLSMILFSTFWMYANFLFGRGSYFNTSHLPSMTTLELINHWE